ncbi:MAG: TraB/GumN family protein [Hyphomicrobiaceae bacterium]
MIFSRLGMMVLAVLAAASFPAPLLARVDQPPACLGRDLLPGLAATAETAARIEAAAAKIANGAALLWRVSRADVKPSYLFGTIHLTDKRVTKLSDAVSSALARAKRVALEVADVSPQAFAVALGRVHDRVVFSDDRSVFETLNETERTSMSAALVGVGIPSESQKALRPWFVTMMLAIPKCERMRLEAGLQPLDLQIGALARKRGAEVLSLETLEGQLSAMASIPETDQIIVLKAALKTIAQTPDAIESMVQRYLSKDIATILPMQAELLRAAGFDPAIMDSFYRAVLSARNPGMRDAALPILAQGEAFIAVGALHLAGENGLVALLRAAGFEVDAIE